MNTRQVEHILLADGWIHKNTKGSHKQFIHPLKPGKVTVPQHSGDLDIGTARSILKQAGITL